MGKIVNACAWLANLANASKQYQIWESYHQLIAEVNNTTCAFHLFALVLYYQTTISFNLLQSCISWILYIFFWGKEHFIARAQISTGTPWSDKVSVVLAVGVSLMSIP